jgi:hypothetical protein
MVGIYIFIFILLLIIFYFVILNIKHQNNNLNIVDKLEIIKSENIDSIMYPEGNNLINSNRTSMEMSDNRTSIEMPNNTISMETPDDIGNIYNDYYNNIDYSEDNGQINPYDNNYKPTQLNKLRDCQVPTLNTDQCHKSRFYECPIVNGSMLQCTNNYIPKPQEYNADCGNRTFEMTPYPWKISENCYYNKIGFDRNKEFDKVRFV